MVTSRSGAFIQPMTRISRGVVSALRGRMGARISSLFAACVGLAPTGGWYTKTVGLTAVSSIGGAFVADVFEEAG